MLHRDGEYHKGSLVGRMTRYHNTTANRIKQTLGVPQMRTVTFRDDDGVDYKVVTKVLQVGAQTLKAYQDTGVELRLEDLIIHDVPRSIPIDHIKFAMVIFGTAESGLERAEVRWVDESNLLTYQVIVRLTQQN